MCTLVTKHTDLHLAAEEYKNAYSRYYAHSQNPAVLPIQLAELDKECDQALEWLLEAKALDSLNKSKKEEPKQLN